MVGVAAAVQLVDDRTDRRPDGGVGQRCGMDGGALAALGAADLVLVPLQATPLALASLTDVAAVLERLSAPPELRAVLVQVNRRRRLTADVRRRVREVFPGVLYRTLVPEDVKAAEAPGYGLPVGRYAGWSRAAKAYRQLAREVEKDLKLEV